MSLMISSPHLLLSLIIQGLYFLNWFSNFPVIYLLFFITFILPCSLYDFHNFIFSIFYYFFSIIKSSSMFYTCLCSLLFSYHKCNISTYLFEDINDRNYSGYIKLKKLDFKTVVCLFGFGFCFSYPTLASNV